MGVTCAVPPVSAVGVDADADVGAVRVLTAGVRVTVRAERALVNICSACTETSVHKTTRPHVNTPDKNTPDKNTPHKNTPHKKQEIREPTQ